MPDIENPRAAIIKAAYEILRDNGLPSISYSAVANASGVSRQLVRYYFKQPDDLMHALCDLMAEQLGEYVLDGSSDRGESTRVEFLLDSFFHLVEGKQKLDQDPVYDAMISLAAGSEGLKEDLQGQFTLLGEVVRHEFHAEYPEMDQASTEELSFLFVSLMYGHWRMVASLGFHEDHNRISRQAMDRLIASYRIQGASDPEGGKVWRKDG